jgi:hypothetical protein
MRPTGVDLLVAACLLPACGGGGAPATTCGNTQPCGGDVVGSWVPAGSCVTTASIQVRYMSQLGDECPPGASVSIVDATSDWAAVSSTFDADGNYAGTAAFSASVQISVPAACLVTRGCADLDAELQAMVSPDTGIASASCHDGAAACTCSVVQQQTSDSSGTYSVSGTTLTMLPTGGSPNDMPFCVRGSELHLINLDNAGIASDIVLRRR